MTGFQPGAAWLCGILLFLSAACGDTTVSADPATLSLTVSSSGEPADVDGYTFSVDSNPASPIGVNASVSLAGLAAGEHELQLDGLAENCEISGENPRTITLAAGQTTEVALIVTCAAVQDPSIARVVPLPGAPYGVAVSSNGTIFAALIGSTTLARGSVASLSFGPVIEVGLTPPHVAFNPAGTVVYATLQTGRGLAVVDVATNTLTTTVPLASDGFNLIVRPDGQVIYVTTADGTLYVVDAATYAVDTTLYVGVAANGLAFSPDGGTLYVSSRDDGTVVAIDPGADTISRTYPIGGAPQRLAVAPDGSELYVANETHGLDIVNVASGSLSTVSFGTAAYGLGLTPDGTQLFVLLPDLGEVRVLDRASRALVKSIRIGGRPRNVAFTADGHLALVTNEEAVTFINLP
jgi:YVTN family beta-propeller protein